MLSNHAAKISHAMQWGTNCKGINHEKLLYCQRTAGLYLVLIASAAYLFYNTGMDMKEFFKTAGLLLACIFLARFIMPANYTPLIAMAVFMPFVTDNKNLQLLLPVSLLLVTDLILGFYGTTMLFVYGTMLLIGLLSRLLHKESIQRLMTNSLLSVVLWHAIVNFGVYLSGLGNVSLAQTYLLAIPFDLRLLTSTLLFAGMFYGIRHLVKEYSYLGGKRIS